MPLTDSAIRTAKPQAKPYKLTDGSGLFLLVNEKGGKWWRLKYRIGGKEKLLSLGTYPDVGLKEARERREQARKLITLGIDPSTQRQAAKAAAEATETERANTFEVIAREWYGVNEAKWAPTYRNKILSRLERLIFPHLGTRPLGEIATQDLRDNLRRIEDKSVDTAHRVRDYCSQVFQYAIDTGRAEKDPTPPSRALKPRKKEHFAAVTDPKEVAKLMRAIDAYRGTAAVECALKLAPLVFVRPGELRTAEWAEIDLDAALWSIPAEKMKMRQPHLVPLSSQAVAILKDLQALTGNGRYLFPSARGKGRPMSDNAILSALRRMEIPKETMTGHGFRAMARTILDEVLGERPDHIEQQLAHSVRDPLGRAYNRTAHLAERRRMMQRWADYLDSLKAGAVVLSLKHKA